MKKKLLIMSTGFALFSMFFGSGNLVFPLAVGQESAGHYMLAALGIFLTGIVVPFLGAFGMMLYQGDLNGFFGLLGKKGIILFSFFALAIMGPFGVLARCLTVAHGAVLQLAPGLPLALTSLVLCALIYLLTVNKNKIIPLLGTLLTPFLLLAIAAIAFFSFTTVPEVTNPDGFTAFKGGFFHGYQTMDLLAAFFFSQFIINHLYSRFTDKKSGLRTFGYAALIGAGLLASVYFVLVMLGWFHAPLLQGVPPQAMLGVIAMKALGRFGAPAFCLAVVLACLTTAIVLTSLFADFLRTTILRDKIGNKPALLITLSIGFVISTLDFAGIAAFLGPLLEIVYPALIVLTLVNIAGKMVKVSQRI